MEQIPTHNTIYEKPFDSIVNFCPHSVLTSVTTPAVQKVIQFFVRHINFKGTTNISIHTHHIQLPTKILSESFDAKWTNSAESPAIFSAWSEVKWSEVNEAKWSGMRWSEVQYMGGGTSLYAKGL